MWCYLHNRAEHGVKILLFKADPLVNKQRHRCTVMIKSKEKTLASSPLVIFELDIQGNVLSMAGGHLDRLELVPEKIIGQSGFRIRNLPVRRVHFDRVVNNKKPIVFSFPFRRYFFETTLTPVLDEQGNVESVTGLSLDITKRIKLENTIDEEHHKLIATQRLNSLAGIANGLAHEINNPLAIISGFSQQLFEMAAAPELKKDRVAYLTERIVVTCERMHRIIVGLQNFSRSSTGEPMELTDIAEIVADCAELYKTRFEASEITYLENINAQDTRLICRPMEVSQSIFNLFTNAFEALREIENPEIKVTVEESGDYLELRVQDNGCGINPNFRSKVFEPFFTTKKVGEGVGMGLSTAKGLIECNNGTLELGKGNKGTTIIIRLPKYESGLRARTA